MNHLSLCIHVWHTPGGGTALNTWPVQWEDLVSLLYREACALRRNSTYWKSMQGFFERSEFDDSEWSSLSHDETFLIWVDSSKMTMSPSMDIKMTHMLRPLRSTELNPAEHLQEILDRHSGRCSPPPSSKFLMREYLLEELQPASTILIHFMLTRGTHAHQKHLPPDHSRPPNFSRKMYCIACDLTVNSTLA